MSPSIPNRTSNAKTPRRQGQQAVSEHREHDASENVGRPGSFGASWRLGVLALKFSIALSFLTSALITPALTAGEAYKVDTITFPHHIVPEVGGLGFTPDGELVVAMRRYGILVAKPEQDPTKFAWRSFSDDLLHNTCGLQVISKSEMIISTMDDVVRVKDTDNDGIADSYQSICADWGMTGNYHETNTLAPDGPNAKNGWWLAIGTASNGGTVFTNIRGTYSAIGQRGRNFSGATWKGWVAHISPEGKFEPYAKGFRANNGINVGPDGKLWVTDNQGDWRGTSPLFHIKKDAFYGHPSSLVWDPTFKSDVDNDPLKHPIEKLEAMRTHAAVEFPQGSMCNSPSEPVFDTKGKFGPFAGQMFIGDVAGGRILRVMLEEVDGVMQGACVKFVDKDLRAGNNRLVFSPDGTQLYTGQTMRGWGTPAEGLQRISFTGENPFDVKTVSLTKEGFVLTFTKPVDPVGGARPGSYKLKRFYYRYSPQYGSPVMEETKLTVGSAVLSADGLTATIAVEGLQTNRLVELDLDVNAADGTRLRQPVVCYTINRLRK
jgi:glucose/arabinose dehydrogenase